MNNIVEEVLDFIAEGLENRCYEFEYELEKEEVTEIENNESFERSVRRILGHFEMSMLTEGEYPTLRIVKL